MSSHSPPLVPNSHETGDDGREAVLSPVKPVNLLPEVPAMGARKYSERELRDCDIIGQFSKLIKKDSY